MIASVLAQVGKPVTFKGYADDYGKKIAAVQFSLDGGENWTTYDTSDSTPELWVNWTFSFTPDESGTYQLLVRSVCEDGRVSPVAAVATIIAE